MSEQGRHTVLSHPTGSLVCVFRLQHEEFLSRKSRIGRELENKMKARLADVLSCFRSEPNTTLIHQQLSRIVFILQLTQQKKYLKLEIYIRVCLQLLRTKIKEFDLITDAIATNNDGYAVKNVIDTM